VSQYTRKSVSFPVGDTVRQYTTSETEAGRITVKVMHLISKAYSQWSYLVRHLGLRCTEVQRDEYSKREPRWIAYSVHGLHASLELLLQRTILHHNGKQYPFVQQFTISNGEYKDCIQQSEGTIPYGKTTQQQMPYINAGYSQPEHLTLSKDADKEAAARQAKRTEGVYVTLPSQQAKYRLATPSVPDVAGLEHRGETSEVVRAENRTHIVPHCKPRSICTKTRKAVR
jgi:hypothetical protein